MNLLGHAWTIVPNVWHDWFPLGTRGATEWSTTVEDSHFGPIRLQGLWHPPPNEADTALVVVHGLGGSPDRHYCARAADAAAGRGWGCLRLGLRGSDRSGEDLYHAGLYADIAAAVASEELSAFRRVFVLGYSLGGHTVLRYLSADPDPRVVAGAAVCSPLHLDHSARHIDEKCTPIYRRHLLAGLFEIYDRLAERRSLPLSAEEVRRARTVREFDDLAIASRFGYASAEEYYARESAHGHIAGLARPFLYCTSAFDPMVPRQVLEATALEAVANAAPFRWIEVAAGGHVNFPARVDLARDQGIDRAVGRLEDQLLAALESTADAPR